ncbi:MAG: MarR family transcriptional regulator [Methanothrix sp.]|nr:MarR family transcriptional regulator [Methanothrix sp.]
MPRIIAFADVVCRYTQLILKSRVSWLRASALIFLITRGGSLTPSQLARIMLRSNYSITKLIDGLEKDRLVKRCPDRKDRRSINVEVTSEGLDYVTSSLSKTVTAERELKSWLSTEELEDLAPTIRKLRDKLIEKISKRHGLSADDRKAIFDKAQAGATEKRL